jgi:hypothetical protein
LDFAVADTDMLRKNLNPQLWTPSTITTGQAIVLSCECRCRCTMTICV